MFGRKIAIRKRGFGTKREMALEQIDYGIENGIPVEVVILDAGFQDEKLTI